MDSVDWMRKELLEEIDRVLIGSEFWQGGRFSTIEWMMKRLKATEAELAQIRPIVDAAREWYKTLLNETIDGKSCYEPETNEEQELINSVQKLRGNNYG